MTTRPNHSESVRTVVGNVCSSLNADADEAIAVGDLAAAGYLLAAERVLTMSLVDFLIDHPPHDEGRAAAPELTSKKKGSAPAAAEAAPRHRHDYTKGDVCPCGQKKSARGRKAADAAPPIDTKTLNLPEPTIAASAPAPAATP